MRTPAARAIVRRAAAAAIAAALLSLGAAAPAYPGTGLDWSESGRLLAFWCPSGLYWVNLEQGGVARATLRGVPARCSPDGTGIAWSDGDATYVQRADSAGAIRIADPGRVAGWSPDSKWVLVESSPPGHAPEIYAASAEGKGVIPLAPHPAWDGNAACSPDGRWVAFVSRRDAERSDIWIVGWDGSHLARVTSMFEATEPRWSPDASGLAFCAKDTESAPRRIYYLDFRTRKLTAVSAAEDGDCRAPRFIGSRYLLYASRGRQLADLRTGARRALTPSGELSPDGRMLAALSGSPGSLEVGALGGGARSALDKGVEACAWSPDGRFLAYLARTAGPANTPVRELRMYAPGARGVYTLWSEGIRSPGGS